MDTELARKLITTIQNDSNAEVLVSGEKTCYITPKNQSYYEHLTNTVKNHVTIVDDLLNIPEPYTKISAYFKDGVNEHYQYYADMFDKVITVQIGGKCWLDCTPKDVNKSTGFLKLLEHLNISAENSVMLVIMIMIDKSYKHVDIQSQWKLQYHLFTNYFQLMQIQSMKQLKIC